LKKYLDFIKYKHLGAINFIVLDTIVLIRVLALIGCKVILEFKKYHSFVKFFGFRVT